MTLRMHKIIPFASFIYFSHVDNAYMNDQINKIRNIEQFIKQNTMILYLQVQDFEGLVEKR